MLLSLTTTHPHAAGLSYLLHKRPDRCQSFAMSFGQVHVFYPENTPDRCTACLLLDVDAVGMMRSTKKDQHFLLGQYVNDRPYVASSFLSVALAQVCASALQGKCKDRPELVDVAMPLEARLDVLPVRGGEAFLQRMFGPLGYDITAHRHTLDDQFPEWGDSPYYTVTLRKTCPLHELLTHLYVLVPVFDGQKHYFVGDDEIDKLLRQGEGWLANHPHKDEITRRYLRNRHSLVRTALARLVSDEKADDDDEVTTPRPEDVLEKPISLNEQRLGATVAALKASGASRVLDLGCGEGKLLRELFRDKQFTELVGMDVSVSALEVAHRRLRFDKLSPRQSERIKLIHGSLMYRDTRLAGFDAAALIEVIEHLDPPRLAALERVVFEFAQPKTLVLTTPNREYNVVWETLPAGKFRHSDHRFEWTRDEFQSWATTQASRFGYAARFLPVGPVHAEHGSPTQMCIFTRT